jgi:polyphosphate kinase
MEIEDYYTFRLTRNADLEIEEEESDNLLESMEQELLRCKFGPPVRLEVDKDIKSNLVKRLKEELSLKDEDISRYAEPLDLTGLNRIADLDRPELKFKPFRNQMAKELREIDPEVMKNCLRQFAEKRFCYIIHTTHLILRLLNILETAARDPHVLAIKQTLYRTSGDSPIVSALIEAAEAGKQVLQ